MQKRLESKGKSETQGEEFAWEKVVHIFEYVNAEEEQHKIRLILSNC